MPPEIVDSYDESLRVVGVVEREIAHRKGILHKTVHCWFVDSNFVYFQIRGERVNFPGLLDVTVGGHASSGEGSETALMREIIEEIGVQRPFSDLVYVGQNRFSYRDDMLFIREFSDVYFARTEGGLSTFFPNPTELDGMAAVPFRRGREVVGGKINDLEVRALLVDSVKRRETLRVISRDSFVPGTMEYFIKVLELGERIAKGKKVLWSGQSPTRSERPKN
jgi:isopentenyldiphosphate isomerase